MKIKLISLLFVLFSFLGFAQSTSITNTLQGKLVTYDIPISLSKATTNYSTSFSLDGYLPYDSTDFFTVAWQSNDTVQVTIALQVMNTVGQLGASYQGSWQTVSTITTVQANAGNDTLYAMNVFQRGAIASGVTDAVTMAGKIGNLARLKVTFANPTTVGNSGQFRVWAYLPKR